MVGMLQSLSEFCCWNNAISTLKEKMFMFVQIKTKQNLETEFFNLLIFQMKNFRNLCLMFSTIIKIQHLPISLLKQPFGIGNMEIS